MSVHGAPNLFRAAGPHGPIAVAADEEGMLKTSPLPCYGLDPTGQLAPLLVDAKGRLLVCDSSSAARSSFKKLAFSLSGQSYQHQPYQPSRAERAERAEPAERAEDSPPKPQEDPSGLSPLQVVCLGLPGNGSLKTVAGPCMVAAVHVKNHTPHRVVCKLRWLYAGPPESESARAEIIATGVSPEFLDTGSIREKLLEMDYSQKIDRILDPHESWTFKPTRPIRAEGSFCAGCLSAAEPSAPGSDGNGAIGLICEFTT